ncbi:hypothetical protein [Echinicola salinicaeni]|uniref:hypothetical protein n=1 Tax=Echinicola salinicaeni TaxID=2762757 RepID=UPI00164508FF|nr:hypothetical protein [Echinicola salinicaeni]
MRKYILILMGLMIFSSCEDDENASSSQLCNDEYFYYSGGGKIYFKPSLYEVWIELEQKGLSREEARSILEKHPFIDTNKMGRGSDNDRFQVNINGVNDCTDLKNYLIVLNNDSEIYSATPVFYSSDDDPMSYLILLSEVLTKNNDETIAESAFIDYAESLNLELIESKHATQQFKVKEVETGFEALEIANEIYETGKVDYSHPNFIANIVLH